MRRIGNNGDSIPSPVARSMASWTTPYAPSLMVRTRSNSSTLRQPILATLATVEVYGFTGLARFDASAASSSSSASLFRGDDGGVGNLTYETIQSRFAEARNPIQPDSHSARSRVHLDWQALAPPTAAPQRQPPSSPALPEPHREATVAVPAAQTPAACHGDHHLRSATAAASLYLTRRAVVADSPSTRSHGAVRSLSRR